MAWMRITPFFPGKLLKSNFVTFLVLVLILVSYQNKIIKFQVLLPSQQLSVCKEFSSKMKFTSTAAPRFFNPLLDVWISDETLFLVFDILHQVESDLSSGQCCLTFEQMRLGVKNYSKEGVLFAPCKTYKFQVYLFNVIITW